MVERERDDVAASLVTEAGERGLILGVELDEITDEVSAGLNAVVGGVEFGSEDPGMKVPVVLTFVVDYENPEDRWRERSQVSCRFFPGSGVLRGQPFRRRASVRRC